MKQFELMDFLQNVVLIFSPYAIDKKHKNSFLEGYRRERAEEFGADLFVQVSQRMGYGLYFDENNHPLVSRVRLYHGLPEIAEMKGTPVASIVDQYEVARSTLEQYIGVAKMEKPIPREWSGISATDLARAVKFLFDFEVDGRKGDYTLEDGTTCSEHLFCLVVSFMRCNRLVFDENLKADYIVRKPILSEQRRLTQKFVNKLLGM